MPFIADLQAAKDVYSKVYLEKKSARTTSESDAHAANGKQEQQNEKADMETETPGGSKANDSTESTEGEMTETLPLQFKKKYFQPLPSILEIALVTDLEK